MPIGIDSLISGGTNLLGGLFKGIVGLGQKRKGNKLLNSLQYPTEQLPDELRQNQIAAQQDAATGLPSQQYANAMKNIQRQQLFAIRGAHDRRGGIGAVSGIQQQSNDASLNLDALDASKFQANRMNLQNVNNQVAGWKSRLFNMNVRDKYLQDRSYGMDLLGAGNQNFAGGVDQGISGAADIGRGLFGGKKQSSGNYSNPYFNLTGD